MSWRLPRGLLAPWLAGLAAAAGLAAQPPSSAPGPASIGDLVLERDDGGRVHLRPLLVRRATLGLEAVDVTPELRRHLGAPADRGVLVAQVAEGGPAAAAAVRVGDLVLAVDAEPIDSTGELDRELRLRPAGDRVALELARDGARLEVAVELVAVERPLFDLGPLVWRWRETGGSRRLLLRPPGGDDELLVDSGQLNELAERLADRLAAPAWQERLQAGELDQRIAQLERRLAELEAELERLGSEP